MTLAFVFISSFCAFIRGQQVDDETFASWQLCFLYILKLKFAINDIVIVAIRKHLANFHMSVMLRFSIIFVIASLLIFILFLSNIFSISFVF